MSDRVSDPGHELSFTGFGGVRLAAEARGREEDPPILLIHGAGETREVWDDVADALVRSGRRTIALDLRGHGASEWPEDGRYDLDAHVEDLRAVLSRLQARPVIVAATLGGWVAMIALAEDAAHLAAGLILVDMPVAAEPHLAATVTARLKGKARKTRSFDERTLGAINVRDVRAQLTAAAPRLALPTLVVRGGLSWVQRSGAGSQFDAALPNGEVVEVADADLLMVTDRTEAFLALLLDFLERKQPRAASEFRAGSDARTLRDAMGLFATGITVVTACEDGQPVGLTANSFTSVSLDPPLLLVCIANTAGSGAVLRRSEVFGVNVLQVAQQQLSSRFAGKAEDRFAATAWTAGETGAPLLDASLVSFECRRHAVHEAGDHFLLIGEVVRAQFEPRRDPLLYYRGKYRRLHFA